MRSVIFSFTILLYLCSNSNGYKILGIFPIKAKSHHIVGSALMKGLAEKGHDVTMLSVFPLKTPIENYRDIPVDNIRNLMKGINVFEITKIGIIDVIRHALNLGVTWTNALFEDSAIKKFMNNKNETFDLVIVENILNEAMVGFGQYFGAPVISVSTDVASLTTCDMVGTPSPLSYVPHKFLNFTDHMSLRERLINLVLYTFERINNDFFYLPKQKEIYDRAFPDPKPSFEKIVKNVSLVLLNSHVSVNYPRPYVPNMIEVGGMHINTKPKPLPADLQKYIDASKDGVIYFSMGSNLESQFLPKEKLDHFINTFKSLKQRVLWKWENETLPVISDNIYISKWFPQDDVLAHPNVKLFITHGGLLSTMEAIYHGVPVIGVPIFADQFLNTGSIVRLKVGLGIRYDELSSDALKIAINEVLGNELYKKSMQELSKRFRDQPMSPLDTAIYWVEYIARHRGAPHLHSAAQDLSFITYHNLDAIVIIGVVILLIFYLLFIMIKILVFWGGLFVKRIYKKEKAQ